MKRALFCVTLALLLCLEFGTALSVQAGQIIPEQSSFETEADGAAVTESDPLMQSEPASDEEDTPMEEETRQPPEESGEASTEEGSPVLTEKSSVEPDVSDETTGDADDNTADRDSNATNEEETLTELVQEEDKSLNAQSANQCGDYLTWSIDGTILTINGTGDMYDYVGESPPWKKYREKIKTVFIQDGVTSIGEYAFSSFRALARVSVPETVTKIGACAFSDCVSLESINLPDSITIIEYRTFYGCKKLSTMNTEQNSEPEKQNNSIIVKNVTKTCSTKKQTITLGAKAKGNAKLSYKSDNKIVTVSSSGKVFIPAKFVGTAKITITAKETSTYQRTSKTVIVMVTPTKTTLSGAKWDNKAVTVSWKKNTTGKGYEVQYSTDKAFKKGNKSVKISKNSTVTTTIKGPKKGTYYIRIRTVSGRMHSGWSKAKTVKITK